MSHFDETYDDEGEYRDVPETLFPLFTAYGDTQESDENSQLGVISQAVSSVANDDIYSDPLLLFPHRTTVPPNKSKSVALLQTVADTEILAKTASISHSDEDETYVDDVNETLDINHLEIGKNEKSALDELEDTDVDDDASNQSSEASEGPDRKKIRWDQNVEMSSPNDAPVSSINNDSVASESEDEMINIDNIDNNELLSDDDDNEHDDGQESEDDDGTKWVPTSDIPSSSTYLDTTDASGQTTEEVLDLTAIFPISRLKKLFKSGLSANPNAMVGSEVMSMLNHVTALMIDELTRASAGQTARKNKKVITYEDVAFVVSNLDRLSFLRDVIPLAPVGGRSTGINYNRSKSYSKTVTSTSAANGTDGSLLPSDVSITTTEGQQEVAIIEGQPQNTNPAKGSKTQETYITNSAGSNGSLIPSQKGLEHFFAKK